MSDTEKSPEVIAAEKEQAAAAKAAEKEAKAAAREQEKAAKAEAKAAEKAAKAAEREAAKAAKEAEKEAAKAAKLSEKEANKMPEQNDVRRPKPTTLCGAVWGIADELSSKLGSPVPVKDLLEACGKQGIKEPTIKTQYARWRKFYGIEGRIVAATEEASA